MSGDLRGEREREREREREGLITLYHRAALNNAKEHGNLQGCPKGKFLQIPPDDSDDQGSPKKRRNNKVFKSNEQYQHSNIYD